MTQPQRYPPFGSVDELVERLEEQARQTFVEGREGASPTPWAWLPRVMIYEPDRQSEVGEALSRLLVAADPCPYYALDQVYRAGPYVLVPVWQNLGTIGPKLLNRDLPDTSDPPLPTLMRYLLMNSGNVPSLPDDAMAFLLGVDESHEDWHLCLLAAAGASPDVHSKTLAKAISRMSELAQAEVIRTFLVTREPFITKGIDAIATLDEATRQQFGKALKAVTDQRDADTAYLLTTASTPERKQQLLDAGDLDIQLGVDWASLAKRLGI